MSDSLASDLKVMVERVAALEGGGLADAQLVDALTLLERLRNAAAAAQARLTVAFDVSQRAADAAAGVPAASRGVGVALQVGLARRESHHRARQLLGLATVVTSEMPELARSWRHGEVSEYRVQVVARETALLSLEHRQQVDAHLARIDGGVGSLGNRQLESETRRHAHLLDPGALVRRRAAAVAQRRVAVRPAPEGMCLLSATLPVADGVRVFATLKHHAATERAGGEARSQGQLMADTLVERVTGQPAGVADVEVHVVMTDQSLWGDSHEPAHVDGHGEVPAAVARDLVRDAARAWVRRLYADPVSGDLVAMESRRREFSGLLRRFLVLRDTTCRTPWCDAPVRHLDHVVTVAEGGRTRAGNGQGLCEACNYAKQATGLQQRPSPRGVVVTRTPTGHTYRSRPPRPPGAPPPVDWTQPELALLRWVDGVPA